MLIGQKKGLLEEMLVMTILAVVFLFIVVPIVQRAISPSEGGAAENLCRDTLAVRARYQIDFGSVAVAPPALCKTLDKDFSADSKEEAKEVIARQFERCWWMWLEGRYSEMLGPRGIFGDDYATKCFVCYTLLYREGPPLDSYDIRDALVETASRYGAGSVSDYIQGRGYVGIYEDIFEERQAAAIVFASNVEEGPWEATFYRQLGFYPTYNQNGIWFIDLQRLQESQPCYLEEDIAGQ